MHVEDPQLSLITAATRRAYDRDASAYADKTDRFSDFPGLKEELERFRGRAPEGPVLDLGCGAGRDTRHLISAGHDVISGDLSVELLKLLRAGPSSKPVQLDLLTLPFRDRVFAGVWASGSLLHIPGSAYPRAFEEIYRVLAEGGATAISLRDDDKEGWHRGERMDVDRWFTWRRPHHVVRELIATGFVSVEWAYCGRKDWYIVEAVKTWAPSHRDGERRAGSA